MPTRLLFFVMLALIVLPCAFAQNGPQSGPQQEARDHLNQGVIDYKSLHYESAMEHFRRVTELDPELILGHLPGPRREQRL